MRRLGPWTASCRSVTIHWYLAGNFFSPCDAEVYVIALWDRGHCHVLCGFYSKTQDGPGGTSRPNPFYTGFEWIHRREIRGNSLQKKHELCSFHQFCFGKNEDIGWLYPLYLDIADLWILVGFIAHWLLPVFSGRLHLSLWSRACSNLAEKDLPHDLPQPPENGDQYPGKPGIVSWPS